MSALPSPLKSPVAIACQLGSSAWTRVSDVGVALALPNVDRSVGVLEEDIGLAVAVEVAGGDRMPARIERLDKGLRCRVAPLIPQMSIAPLVFWKRISALPSPSKSPVSIACQLGSRLWTRVSDVGVVPFIPQMSIAPLVFWKGMSAVPSLSKSPVPITCQLGSRVDESRWWELCRSSSRCRPPHWCSERGCRTCRPAVEVAGRGRGRRAEANFCPPPLPSGLR